MAFKLPTFNLTCNIYTNRNFSVSPRLSSLCCLAIGRRVQVPASGGTATRGVVIFDMQLLLPKLTDIRFVLNTTHQDGVEVPAGSGRKYDVEWVEDAGKGFPNEHRVAWIYMTQCPTPLP